MACPLKYIYVIFVCNIFILNFILSLIASELAKMHAKLPLETDPRANPLYLSRVAFDHVPKTLKDPEMQSR